MSLRLHLRALSADERLALAAQAGTSVGYLWQLAGKHRDASPKLALAIERATQGTVTRAMLRPDLWSEAHGGPAPATASQPGGVAA